MLDIRDQLCQVWEGNLHLTGLVKSCLLPRA